jgi:DHA1 family tetracycline resistance protein-like MFS transporter
LNNSRYWPGVSVQTAYVILGALVASYPLAQFFAAPILGQLSDRYGRRPILIWSLLGTAVGYALFAVAIYTRHIPLLFASRVLDGITGGNIPVAQAALADNTEPKDRAKNFGLMGAAFGLGFIIGPYIGGQLADASLVSWFGPAVPFWFAALISFINMIFIWLMMPETSPMKAGARLHWGQSVTHIVKAFSHKQLRFIFLTGFLFFSGFSFFTTFFGVYLIDRFGFTESDTGNFFAYVGIWIVITQAVITPRVSRIWKERMVLNVGFCAAAVALLLFHAPGPWTVLLVTTPLFAIFNGLTQSNYMAFLSRSAGADVQGEILGINASIGALSQAIPPVLAGLIASGGDTGVTLYAAAGIMFVAGLLFLATVRHDPRPEVHA